MTAYDSTFGQIEPGSPFLMPNTAYSAKLWPKCGTALVEWRKLVCATAEGMNAADHCGRLHRLADDTDVGAFR